MIWIIADDLGYADLGFTGCEDIPTPHLDRLAQGGVVCTDGHVTASVCAPSRTPLAASASSKRSFWSRCSMVWFTSENSACHLGGRLEAASGLQHQPEPEAA